MGEKERAFRERMARIARITRVQKIEEIRQMETEEKEEEKKEFEILPAICKVKKNIENFRTKPIEEVQER